MPLIAQTSSSSPADHRFIFLSRSRPRQSFFDWSLRSPKKMIRIFFPFRKPILIRASKKETMDMHLLTYSMSRPIRRKNVNQHFEILVLQFWSKVQGIRKIKLTLLHNKFFNISDSEIGWSVLEKGVLKRVKRRNAAY